MSRSMVDLADWTPLGRRLVAPAVTHFCLRAGTETVAGSVSTAAGLAAGRALESMCLEPIPDDDGVDVNPFTRRRSELTPTALLRSMRPASAHFLVSLLENADDRALLGRLMGLKADAAASRLFALHAEIFELGRESQSSIIEYWSVKSDETRYTAGIWGLVTAAAFGVRHLDRTSAAGFRDRLDAQAASFFSRLAECLRALQRHLDGALPATAGL